MHTHTDIHACIHACMHARIIVTKYGHSWLTDANQAATHDKKNIWLKSLPGALAAVGLEVRVYEFELCQARSGFRAKDFG